MTDWDRLTEYIYDYFPEPKYSTQDIRDWAMKNVPSWKYMSEDTREGILGDWVEFITPMKEELEERIEGVLEEEVGKEFVKEEKGFLGRIADLIREKIRKFLGKLY